MTDINTELERIADETLGNPLEEAQGNLDTKGDPRAPMKGAAKAQKEAKLNGGTPGGETVDMGPAVVSPEAKSDPGSAATKRRKRLVLLQPNLLTLLQNLWVMAVVR